MKNDTMKALIWFAYVVTLGLCLRLRPNRSSAKKEMPLWRQVDWKITHYKGSLLDYSFVDVEENLGGLLQYYTQIKCMIKRL